MYISALYRMLRSRTFKRTATSDEHARKFRIWRSLVLIDISKLMSLNSVVLVITQLNSFYVFSFGLVYSARATGCCNEAILFVLVDFTSIVGSISNRNKMQWNYSFGSGRAWVLLFAGNVCGKSFERACYSRVIFEISPIRSSRRRVLLEKFQTIVNDF